MFHSKIREYQLNYYLPYTVANPHRIRPHSPVLHHINTEWIYSGSPRGIWKVHKNGICPLKHKSIAYILVKHLLYKWPL